MPPSHHGPSAMSSSSLLQQNYPQPVGETACLECFASCSGLCGGRIPSYSSGASRDNENGKVSTLSNTGAEVLDASAEISLTSSVAELIKSIPDEEELEGAKAATRNHVKATEEGSGKDDMLRPPSPFVVLGYGERGGDLKSNGVADVNIIDLEVELASLRNKLTTLRTEEEERRQQLYGVWKQKNQRPARGSSSSLRPSRGRRNRSRNMRSTVDDVSGAKTNGSSDATSSVTCNTATAIGKGIPTSPAEDEGAHEGENNAGNTAVVDEASPGCNDDINFSFRGRRPWAARSGMILDPAEARGGNCTSSGNDISLPAPRSQNSRFDDVPRAGKKRSKGRRAKKPTCTVAAAAEEKDHDVSTGDNCGGTESPHPCGDENCDGNGWMAHDGEVDCSYSPLSLMQTGSGGMLEFVFDEDDAAKRRAFRESETTLMLAEQRVLLQMETLHHSRPQTGRHYWQSNESVTHCTRCGKPFSMTVRKHHCRRCGILLCNDCCSQVGRDMYALQHDRMSEEDEEDVVVVDDTGETQITEVAESTSSQKNEYEWMFDTYELTDGTNWRQGGGDDDKLFPQRPRAAGSHGAHGSGRGRGGLKVRTAPWCRICNCCYLICLRARIERNYSDVLSDGRRRFHVLRDDEQAFTNLNMAWEARVAQLDVLKHLIVERATSAAQGQVDHFAGLLKEWVCSLGRRAESNPIDSNSGRSSCGSGSQ